MTHNKKPAEDLRVRRTRKLLMQALIDLTVEKGFSALTVQDIADRAMVHRATFYRHYRDKYDLLDQYMHEVYELTDSHEEQASAQTGNNSSGNPPVGMVRLLERVQDHADFYRAMLGAKGDPGFVQGIRRYSEMRLHDIVSSDDVQSKLKGLPVELCLSYLSHAGVGVLAWWLNAGQSYTPAQAAAWHMQLISGSLGKADGSKEPEDTVA